MLRLSYRELGDRLGLTPDGARMLAGRREWPRVRGNDGRTKVTVTDDDLANARVANVRPNAFDAELRAMLVTAQADLAVARAEGMVLVEAKARAEGEAAALRAQVLDLAARLDRAELRLAMPWWRRLLG